MKTDTEEEKMVQTDTDQNWKALLEKEKETRVQAEEKIHKLEEEIRKLEKEISKGSLS